MSNAPTHSVHSAITAGSLLLVLVLLLGCMTPDAALAVDGYESLGFRTISNECGPFGVGKYEAQDSSIAYCMNQDRFGPSTPGGPWLTYNQGWVWLEDEFAAIICHGYPTATSFGGHNLSPDRARAATQLAVWMLNGTTHTDGSFSYTTAQGVTKSGNFSGDNEVVAAARWLHDSAKSGSIKAAPHRARRYLGTVSGGSKRQDMLYVLPAVSASFQKQSANAAITSENDTYRLDGARFDIYESAGDKRVGSIQMDSSGRAQATLLPNTAYYLVETKAPAGYIPRSDRIAFSTGNDGGNVVIDEQPGTITLRIAKVDARQGQVLKSVRHLPVLSSPASHSLLRAGRTPSQRMRTGGQHLPTSPWAPLASMSRELPRVICPPMKPGAIPSVPTSSETRASLNSSVASPTSPSLLTSRFQSSRTAVIVTNLV